ncbi:MAG: leucine-rich repeat protein [Coriobacteriia bacterium]|nr:leucine-rich repeat protein [Coriobacteriia bacterium]
MSKSMYKQKHGILFIMLSFLMSVSTIAALPSLVYADQEADGRTAYPGQTEAPGSNAMPDYVLGDYFQLDIVIPTNGHAFYLPTNSHLYGDSYYEKHYDWIIDWGDGCLELASGTSKHNSGISHTYKVASAYTVTVSPNGSTEAWLAAFGFGDYIENSLVLESKAMVVGVPCFLTPGMTRTNLQIAGYKFAPSHEWAYAFNGCTNLRQSPQFAGWEEVSTVSDYFAYAMFKDCKSLTSMQANFNLPEGLTEVGEAFAGWMFFGCTSLQSVSTVFNFPTGIVSVKDAFASSMFRNCTSLQKLPYGFNFPQQLTKVGRSFADNMLYNCASLTILPDGFSLPQSIESVGSGFAMGMFQDCASLTALPDGFNLPTKLISVGDYFADSMFFNCKKLESLPGGFSFPYGYTEVGDSFAAYMFFYCESLSTLPDGFNLPDDIQVVGDSFAYYMFSLCTSLTELPAGFNLPPNISKTGDDFVYGMFRICSSLTTLPKGFSFPQNILEAEDNFAYGMFSLCTYLVELPEGFNLPQNITEAGDCFAGAIFSSCKCLGALPSGFNLPANISSVGRAFAIDMFNQAGGEAFQINEEFCFPTGIPADAQGAFSLIFRLNADAPVQSRTAASIIRYCPTPIEGTGAFDTHFTDLPYIHVNWGGKAVIIESAGSPGSGDLNGDGMVTMDEAIITLRATIGDHTLTNDQFLAIDMDNDNVITMADVVAVLRKTV